MRTFFLKKYPLRQINLSFATIYLPFIIRGQSMFYANLKSLISVRSQSRLNEFDLIASSINGGTFHRSYLPEHHRFIQSFVTVEFKIGFISTFVNNSGCLSTIAITIFCFRHTEVQISLSNYEINSIILMWFTYKSRTNVIILPDYILLYR